MVRATWQFSVDQSRAGGVVVTLLVVTITL